RARNRWRVSWSARRRRPCSTPTPRWSTSTPVPSSRGSRTAARSISRIRPRRNSCSKPSVTSIASMTCSTPSQAERAATRPRAPRSPTSFSRASARSGRSAGPRAASSSRRRPRPSPAIASPIRARSRSCSTTTSSHGAARRSSTTEMKYRYSRFIASLADDVDIDKLMSRLSDLFLSSGFGNPHDPQSDDDRAMQALYDAILDALLNGGALSDEMAERLFSHDGTPEGIERQRQQIDQLVQQLIERLGEQGYISLTG